MTRFFSRAWAWVFPMPRISELLEEQIADAQREALTHAAAAEHHQALQKMYEGRAQRLQGMLNTGTTP